MRMARAFMAAVPLALVLVAAVVVPVALPPGTFGFRSWPASPAAPPRENAVVVEQQLPSAGSTRRGADPVRPARPQPDRRSVQVAAVDRQRRPVRRTPHAAREVVAAAPRPAPRHPTPVRAPNSGDAPNPPPARPPAPPAPAGPTPIAQVAPPAPTPAAPQVEARPVAPPAEPVSTVDDDDPAGLRGHGSVWSRAGRDRGHRHGW